MSDSLRMPYPTGDLEHGERVQVTKSPVEEVDWLAYEDLTVSSTALSLTYNDNGYDRASIVVETDAVRFRLDNGNVPTATSGMIITAGTGIELDSAKEIRDFRVIRANLDATLRVHYGKSTRMMQ